jgi:hypothetical protein
VDELWLPGLIVIALVGLMYYALAATTHAPLFGSVGLGDVANLAVAGVTLLLVMVTRRSVKVSERALTRRGDGVEQRDCDEPGARRAQRAGAAQGIGRSARSP